MNPSKLWQILTEKLKPRYQQKWLITIRNQQIKLLTKTTVVNNCVMTCTLRRFPS